MLFDITNRIEVIAKYNDGKPWKRSFSYPAIMITNVSMIKGNINRTIGAIISTKGFLLLIWYNGIMILLRPCHKSNGFLDQSA